MPQTKVCDSDAATGTWKNLAPIPHTSLELLEQRLEGEEKQLFLTFMREMLQWDPQDRQDSEQVYWDEWFLADLIASGEVFAMTELSTTWVEISNTPLITHKARCVRCGNGSSLWPQFQQLFVAISTTITNANGVLQPIHPGNEQTSS
jgi:hypothetical protein